ncbi:Patatin-like phospholipase/acyl hydrolase [Anaerosporobacter mobilis DSM 15930]|jgi:patatin-like phospholipase/acyl hydrolase|uniref:Patatin-like phospholipase/acyl hydrolase n=1 Tax=Anaerosporobacter mobilis DSM 15930 TaxID=1120996 RepID=A0A1M7LRL8_9FIRM|nr:patatin-like phospholipase family protein [Anaerosporobacter mobilis]SHM80324.1 Patatin-like phospholipase/acyl hydrolase [Anaerosporobacter mobilis DSM 15930]
MSTTILSIDGGGMKGIVSALVLIELEDILKKYTGANTVYLVDYFDLIAGTSTGSILAALLLCPNDCNRPKYTASDALNLYLTKGKTMFQTNPLHKLRTLGGLIGPKYKNKALVAELNSYFGSVKTAELLKPCLLTSYNMTTRDSLFFNSLSSLKSEDRNFNLADAVLASTAAPTFFPPSCIKAYNSCEDCLVDGGVFANNPSLCALIEALKLERTKNINDTMVLSIGNVYSAKSYDYNKVKHWGAINWAFPLLDVLMDASEQTVDYQLNKLYSTLGVSNQYLRVVANVNENVPSMDDTSQKAIDRLLEIGNELVKKKHRDLEHYARMLFDNHKRNQIKDTRRVI